MTVDPKLICAELRASDLLCVLQSAYNGAPHWRRDAGQLLRSIERLELPEPLPERLRETDHRKRVAEIIADSI